MSVRARVKDPSVAELVNILLHADCCVEVAHWLQAIVVYDRSCFNLIVVSLLIVVSSMQLLVSNCVLYSVCCRSGGTAATVHGNARSVLLLLCTPITKGGVDPVSQVRVGGKGGIQLPLANRIGVGLWPS
jgi:putative component of membrane protein insertase Oxa1/YidC/SpoIIIJ protein YidD